MNNFLIGCVGAAAPEIWRLYNLRHFPRVKWSWQYFLYSIPFIALGGFIASILEPANNWTAFYTGLTTPVLLTTAMKDNNQARRELLKAQAELEWLEKELEEIKQEQENVKRKKEQGNVDELLAKALIKENDKSQQLSDSLSVALRILQDDIDRMISISRTLKWITSNLRRKNVRAKRTQWNNFLNGL